MEIIEQRITLEDVSEPMRIVPLGDVHYGNINCDVKKFKETIEYIKNTTNCYTIIMGDMCDAVMISDKRFDISTVAPELREKVNDLGMAQYEAMRNMLLPIKGKILAAVDGNHGDTMYTKYHTDYDAWLYRELNVPDMGTAGFLVIKFNREQYHTETVTVFMHHGFIAGRKSGGKLNAMEDLSASYDADVFLMGHSHDLFAKSKARVSVAGTKLKVRKQYFAQTGTFLQTYVQGTNCYAEKAGYPPTKTGCIKIKLYPKPTGVDIHVTE